MLSIVYASSAVESFSEDDLVALLKQSREKNTQLELSGLLLYKDGNFLQVLEGPDEAIRRLFKVICADYRHRGVIRLLEEQIERRQFGGWAMAYRNLNDPALHDIPGYSNFMNEDLDPSMLHFKPSKAQRLLQIFRNSM